MRAPSRLWRTADGRLVLDGDPAATVLAYGPGDEVTAADAKRLPGKTPTQPEPVQSDTVDESEDDQDVTEVEPQPPGADDEPEKKDTADDEDVPEKKAAPATAPKRQRGGRRKTSEGEGRW